MKTEEKTRETTENPYTGNEDKRYRVLDMGRRRYTVSAHNGREFYKDGSPFYGIAIFHSKRARDIYVRSLVKLGYRERPS